MAADPSPMWRPTAGPLARALLDQASDPPGLRSIPQERLPDLALALREELIQTVSQTGGHLGAGLGVVEMTVALHFAFQTPKDILIWDVGHQAYPHKMLTGRRAAMPTIRQGGGLSGFTKRDESDYDPFGAAHAGTSISAALGFCASRDRRGEDHHVVAVIGDGSLSAGMAYEALNMAATTTQRLIVIINDNGMSIAPPVGAISAALATGKPSVFEALDMPVLGPIDGHDIDALLLAFAALKAHSNGPVALHVKTIKGKGYPPAEAAADCMHGVVRFATETGRALKPSGPPAARLPTFTEAFAESLQAQAARDEAIVAVTAAMPTGTGLDGFARSFPERFFDVGIAEQHAVTFAAGMAAGGLKPFVAIYSSFLQRGYDQVVHDVALQGLPVRFALDRAGLVGADGATHAGSFDIGYLSALPGFVVMAPADTHEVARMMATAAAFDDGPIALRYPRGTSVENSLMQNPAPLHIGKGRIVREGSSVALVSLGHRFADACEAAARLDECGVSVTLADARFAKPLDVALLALLAREHEILVTIEEGAIGGFGALVLQALAKDGHLDRGLKVRTLHLPDRFQNQDTQDAQVRKAGLDADAIVACVLQALGRQARREWLRHEDALLVASLAPA